MLRIATRSNNEAAKLGNTGAQTDAIALMMRCVDCWFDRLTISVSSEYRSAGCQLFRCVYDFITIVHQIVIHPFPAVTDSD